jgi:hypothetical protein
MPDMPARKASVIFFGALAVALSLPYGFAQQTRPSWIPTGSLNIAREYHTATPLADGRVLVIGGLGTTITTTSTGSAWYADGNPKNTAEIYDPASATWRATGSLNIARYNPIATLLPTGQVLVTGGCE